MRLKPTTYGLQGEHMHCYVIYTKAVQWSTACQIVYTETNHLTSGLVNLNTASTCTETNHLTSGLVDLNTASTCIETNHLTSGLVDLNTASTCTETNHLTSGLVDLNTASTCRHSFYWRRTCIQAHHLPLHCVLYEHPHH